MSLCNENDDFLANEEFLAISIPIVVQKKFEDLQNELNIALKQNNIRDDCIFNRVIDYINQIHQVTKKVTKKLKSEAMMFLVIETIEKLYFVSIVDIKKNDNTAIGFKQWCLQNLKKQEQYGLQLYFRLLSIRTYHESKILLQDVPKQNNYKQKYENQITQAIQNIKALSKIYSNFNDSSLINQVLNASLNKCKAQIFYNYLREFFEELELMENIELIDQLQKQLEEQQTLKLQNRKNQFNIDNHTLNSKDNQILRASVSNKDRNYTECSSQSFHSYTPQLQDPDRKDLRLLTFIRKTSVTNQSKFELNVEKIDLKRGFLNVSQMNEQGQKLFQDNENEDKKQQLINLPNKTFKNDGLFDKLKKDGQQSFKAIQEKDLSQIYKVKRTIGSTMNPKYKLQNDKSRISSFQQKINDTQQPSSIQRKDCTDESYINNRSISVSQENNLHQLQFCQNVASKLVQIKTELKKSSLMKKDYKQKLNQYLIRNNQNILALDTPQREFDEDSSHPSYFQ